MLSMKILSRQCTFSHQHPNLLFSGRVIAVTASYLIEGIVSQLSVTDLLIYRNGTTIWSKKKDIINMLSLEVWLLDFWFFPTF
jgi:hypothetical protein